MDDERKQIILEVLADKYCKQILHDTLEKPKSAMELSSDKKIPISTVYRRLQTLYDAKLLGIFILHLLRLECCIGCCYRRVVIVTITPEVIGLRKHVLPTHSERDT